MLFPCAMTCDPPITYANLSATVEPWRLVSIPAGLHPIDSTELPLVGDVADADVKAYANAQGSTDPPKEVRMSNCIGPGILPTRLAALMSVLIHVDPHHDVYHGIPLFKVWRSQRGEACIILKFPVACICSLGSVALGLRVACLEALNHTLRSSSSAIQSYGHSYNISSLVPRGNRCVRFEPDQSGNKCIVCGRMGPV